ncbi:hypothetical protein B0I35DRAFT_221462 [Stachybotrys elegans]|uniref:Uncharacterized protein n=1 Tax=Stachybotrys elegans TaxID=80388 RepID=A0A8K0WR65_9HYPO|nr:hypothetical protein B0I35DRAFT_221462 [Stachybotrys elegans]
MASQPIVFPPAPPSELISYILSHHRHPSTLIIGASKHEFLSALLHDLHEQTQGQDTPGDTPVNNHDLLRAPLMQIAVSRHIRTVFLPTVTHLRAYLSCFSAFDAKQPPPLEQGPQEQQQQQTATLLVYGFLDLHRDGSEWSAQGIQTSAATLIDAAAQSGFRAVLAEPCASSQDPGALDALLNEDIPILSGALPGGGTRSARTVPIRSVLGRWFEFQGNQANTTLLTS